MGPFRGIRWDSCVNLFNSIVGAGILSLPLSFSRLGWRLGVAATLAYCAFSIVCGLMLLSAARHFKGQHPERFAEDRKGASSSSKVTYEDLVDEYIGGFGARLLGVCIISRNIGILFGYAVIIGDFWVMVIDVFQLRLGMSVQGARLLFVFLFLVLLSGSLTAVMRMELLRWANLLCTLAVVYALCIIAVEMGLSGREGTVRAGPLGWTDALRALSLLSLAFSATANIIPIWSEHPEQSIHFVTAAQLSAGALYLSFAMLGYFRWGDGVQGNVLNHYVSREQPWVSSLPAVFTLIVSVSYALVNFVLRISIDDMLSKIPYLGRRFFKTHSNTEVTHSTLIRIDNLKKWRYYAYSLFFLVLSYVVGTQWRSLDVILAITGSLFTSFTSFVIPCMLYWFFRRKRLSSLLVLSLLISASLLLGVLGLVLEVVEL